MLWVLERVEEAESILRETIRRHPSYLTAYLRLAHQLRWRSRLGEGLLLAQAAVKVDPYHFFARLSSCTWSLELLMVDESERCHSELERDFPEKSRGFGAEVYFYRGEFDKALQYFEEIARDDKRLSTRMKLSAAYYMTGQVDTSIAVWEEIAPWIFSDEDLPPIGTGNWAFPLGAATILIETGKPDRANEILDAMLTRMKTMSRTRGMGYGAWDAAVYALRGDKVRTIASFRDAIREGWRTDWWWFIRHSVFDDLRDDPEWVALVAELEEDIARQRQWYEEHKDEPLF